MIDDDLAMALLRALPHVASTLRTVSSLEDRKVLRRRLDAWCTQRKAAVDSEIERLPDSVARSAVIAHRDQVARWHLELTTLATPAV